jgi:hypothetical protein
MLLIVPGYFPASFVALAGPIVYVIGAMFSTAGLRQFSKTATAIASRADILYCAVTVQSLEDRSHLIADRRTGEVVAPGFDREAALAGERANGSWPELNRPRIPQCSVIYQERVRELPLLPEDR